MVIEASNNVYYAAAAAFLGAICVGVMIGFSGPAFETMITQPKMNNTNSTDSNRIAESGDRSIIGSSITLGALVGGLIGGTIAQTIGRKKTLVMLGVPFAVACGIMYIAKSVTFVVVGRILTGLVSGMICVTAPSYVIELSTPKTRGFLGTCFQICVTIGIFLMAFFGIFATNTFKNFFNWRYLALFGVLPSLGMSFAMLGMPESPTWLISKYGRTSIKTEKALCKVRSPKSDIQGELDELQEQANQAKTNTYSVDQLKKPDFWKPAVIGISLMFFQQFSGINIVMFYQTEILKDAFSPSANDSNSKEIDLRSNYAAIGTAVSCFAQILATIAAAMIMDKLGRRKLLLCSGGGHAVSLFVLGFYFYKYTAKDVVTNEMVTKGPIPIPITCLVVYIISFSLGYGPIPWLMIPEMTPSSVRSLISSVATGFNWSCAFFTSFTFAGLKNAIGTPATFWLYAAICVLSCVFVLFFLPETKGKTFDEIQKEFTGTAGPPTSPQSLTRAPSKSGQSVPRTASKDKSVSPESTPLTSVGSSPAPGSPEKPETNAV